MPTQSTSSRNVFRQIWTWVADVDAARAAMILGVAFVGIILVALGIKDDLLISMVRNLPVQVAVAFSLVLVGLALPFIKIGETPSKVFSILGLTCLIGGAVVTIAVATYSFTVREQPTLTATTTWSAEVPGDVTVTFDAKASSLQAEDDLFLRVIGITPDAKLNLRQTCADALSDSDGKEYEVLYWGTSGPTKKGDATISFTAPTSKSEFSYICAYAALRAKTGTITDRWATSAVDLDRPVPEETAVIDTATPSPTP